MEAFYRGLAPVRARGISFQLASPCISQNWLNRRIEMTATLVRLLPIDEMAVLKCYVEKTPETGEVLALYEEMAVPRDSFVPRLPIAVAQILLHEIQDSLPQWSAATEDGLVLNRKWHQRHKDARLAFNPILVCTINWANSGPGYSWPEAYHVTYLPGFDKFVVTASRDGADLWGCADHAIGIAAGNLAATEAAKKIILDFWQTLSGTRGQARWEHLFDEGLIDKATAGNWADEVWCAQDER